MKQRIRRTTMTVFMAACCGNAVTTLAAYPELVRRYGDLGMGTSKMTHPEVPRFINRQFEVWVPAIKAMDLKLD